jgi:hypothetical protein
MQRNGAYVPTHPGNGLLRGDGFSTCIDGQNPSSAPPTRMTQ